MPRLEKSVDIIDLFFSEIYSFVQREKIQFFGKNSQNHNVRDLIFVQLQIKYNSYNNQKTY